jgi:hypothetical protein
VVVLFVLVLVVDFQLVKRLAYSFLSPAYHVRERLSDEAMNFAGFYHTILAEVD